MLCWLTAALSITAALDYKTPLPDQHAINSTQQPLDDLPLLTIAKTWWLTNTQPVQYAYGYDDDLQPLSGFQFCRHLDNSHFDMSTLFDISLIETILQHNVSQLEQLKNDKKLARMLSPTLATVSSSHMKTTARNISHNQLVRMVDTVAVVLWQSMLYNQYQASDEEIERHYLAQQSDGGQKVFQRRAGRFLQSSFDSYEASRRWACFHAADANNAHVQWSMSPQTKFLRFVHGQQYFESAIDFRSDEDLRIREVHLSSIDYEGKQKHLQSEESQFVDQQNTLDLHSYNVTRKQQKKLIKNLSKSLYREPVQQEHRLAYFIMAHTGFTNLINLLQAIHDPYAVILVHIDGKNKIMKRQIVKYLEMHPMKGVHVMEQSFYGVWGQSSLVYCQLAGYFELLRLNQQWEYVINLSVNDYPTRYNDVIYQDLKRQCQGPCSWIGYWSSIDAYERVYNIPMVPPQEMHVRMKSQSSYLVDPNTLLATRVTPQPSTLLLMQSALHVSENVCDIREVFPYSHWALYKHHQWMILSRQVVEHLQHSSTAQYMAAYMEFSYIPDEVYIATVLQNGLSFSGQQIKSNFGKYTGVGTIINDSKRYLEFGFASHPRKLASMDLEYIADAVFTRGVVSTRKVDVGALLDRWGLSQLITANVSGCTYVSESEFDCLQCSLMEEPQLKMDASACKLMAAFQDKLSYRDAHKVDQVPFKDSATELFIHQMNQLRNFDWQQTFNKTRE